MKPIDKKLRQIALMLPLDMEVYVEKYTATAEEVEEDIKLGGTMKDESEEAKAKAVQLADLGMIEKRRAVKREKNHIRRLRRAWQRDGIKGVLKYVKPYLNDETREETVAKIQMYLL